MKVKNVRIDERLIHGQVGAVWTNTLGAQRIIIANDESIKDEMQIAVLKMACPAGVKLSLLSVSKAVVNINSGKYDHEPYLLIFKRILDCKRALDEGLETDVINIGNVSMKEGATQIKRSVSVLPEEVTAIREILATGVKITCQMVPTEPLSSIEEFLK